MSKNGCIMVAIYRCLENESAGPRPFQRGPFFLSFSFATVQALCSVDIGGRRWPEVCAVSSLWRCYFHQHGWFFKASWLPALWYRLGLRGCFLWSSFAVVEAVSLGHSLTSSNSAALTFRVSVLIFLVIVKLAFLLTFSQQRWWSSWWKWKEQIQCCFYMLCLPKSRSGADRNFLML